MTEPEFYFIAHRGEYLILQNGEAVYDAPEGSRPAYERVRDSKINAVKLDIQYTADKIIVMSHDTNLERTTGVNLPIKETSYEELKKATFLKCGEYGNEKILTFDEALEIVKDVPLYYIDFKNYSDEMLKDVFSKLAKHGISSRKVIVATFTMEALRGVQKFYPSVRRVLHIGYGEQEDGTFIANHQVPCVDFAAVKAQMLAWEKELGLYGFNVPASSEQTTPEFIKELKAEGCWISIWFVHSTADADKFRYTGVDAFVTGMPSTIREYLTRNPEKQ